MRLAAGLFALLFLFGAAVQYNDPDPWGWAAIYLVAAAACFLTALGRGRWWIPAAVSAAALAWAVTLAPRVAGEVHVAELFADWEMADARIEEGREMYGLLIIAAANAVLAAAAWRTRAAHQ